MDKKKKLRSKKIAGIRGWIQAAATLLTNPHIPNFFQGKIYQGKAKTVCVPGLNCYSCPAATGACPIGAFQAVVGSSKFKFSYYITGFLILLGVTLGRFICGFLCPFGWFQDLLHKIPGKKFSTARLKPLRYLKYIILAVFVILLPMFATNSIGMGDPFFCKYICPITIFLKPASYFALLRVKNNVEKCVSCGKCKSVCPMDVDVPNNSRNRRNGTECIVCFRCIEECPEKSLHL